MAPLEFENIFGVHVSKVNLDLASAAIEEWIRIKKKAYVCVAPVSTIVECQSNHAYRKVVNEADMVTPDGMPVVWISRRKGNRQVRRTYGPDLLIKLCSLSEEKGYQHYFYGGTSNVCALLSSKLQSRFPRLNVVGYFSPPFRKEAFDENPDVLNEINRLKPDILWVGLGSPKQDSWMVRHREKLDVPVMIGVGAAFDFLSGVKKQAPIWMQKNGLEWLFRLCSEPERLWKRYLIGNSIFVWLVIKEFIRKGFRF